MTAIQRIELDNLNKEHWYNWQQPACPLLLAGCLDACGERFRATFGIPFFTSILYFRYVKDHDALQGSWLLRLNEGTNCGTYLVDLLQLESFRRKVSVGFTEISTSLEAVALEIENRQDDLPKQLPELGKLAATFFSKFWPFYTLGAITEPVQWRVESIIRTDLVGSKAGFAEGAAARTWDTGKIMSAAFTTEAEPYALGILDDLGCLTALAEKTLRRALSKPGSSLHQSGPLEDLQHATKVLNEDAEFTTLADQHVARYFWKQSNYLRGLLYDRKSCVEEVLKALQSAEAETAKDLKSQSDEAHRTRQSLLASRSELLSSVSDYHRRLILLGDEFGSGMADRRKKTMLRSLTALETLAQAIAKAAGIERDEIGMLMPEEVPSFCERPEVFKERLSSRRDGFLLIESPFPLLSNEFNSLAEVVVQQGAVRVPPRQGPTYVEAEQIANVFAELDANLRIMHTRDDDAELSGDVAFSDSHRSVVGRARIVRNPAVDRFEPGEILIATSTTPDFMAQIRVAKAIVTDQGGMATHAALASRELKIPCIVGTAVGTLKIKSGAMIELDLQTGHVRVVK
jgi:phosphohistidine swiveling domain-containing protein